MWFERHPNGLRLHVGRWRWHHYSSGFVLVGVGVYLIAADWPDLAAVLRPTRFSTSTP